MTFNLNKIFPIIHSASDKYLQQMSVYNKYGDFLYCMTFYWNIISWSKMDCNQRFDCVPFVTILKLVTPKHTATPNSSCKGSYLSGRRETSDTSAAETLLLPCLWGGRALMNEYRPETSPCFLIFGKGTCNSMKIKILLSILSLAWYDTRPQIWNTK